MVDLEKLVPKLPDFAFRYWDCFLGICFVLAALAAFLKKIPHAIELMLSGFCMIPFCMARQRWHYIGVIRLSSYATRYKWKVVYPTILAFMFCVSFSWAFFVTQL